jgi:GNAT superfamily N-acetyltransferase
MALPSFDNAWREGPWREGQCVKPRILVLEVRDKAQPEAQALGWVLVERVETYLRDSDGMIYKASIRLLYQTITTRFSRQNDGNGGFDGSYCYSRYNNSNAVSLTSPSMSSGAVFLDLPGLSGQRIGTYLMNEIVQWVQQWPDATVNSIRLSAGQASDDNKARRNWFYEQFGLVFDYTDPEHREGLSRPMQAKALTTVETWKQNIIEHRMPDYLASILHAGEHATLELQRSERACAELIAEQRKAEARPLLWALRQLCHRHTNTIFTWLILLIVVGMVWNSLTPI